MVKEVLNKLAHQTLEVNEDAYNIVMVGRTGAGKSYFGNALLGVLEPGRQTDVPFPAKETDASVTQNIKAKTGILFGGLYDKVLGKTLLCLSFQPIIKTHFKTMYTIGDWLKLKFGTKSPPLLSVRYNYFC